MEHRTDQRIAANLMAEVYRQGMSLGHFRVDNISDGGISIVDQTEVLSIHDFVRVTLKLPKYSDKPTQTFYALVVQNGSKSAGAMWAAGQIDLPFIMKRLDAVAA